MHVSTIGQKVKGWVRVRVATTHVRSIGLHADTTAHFMPPLSVLSCRKHYVFDLSIHLCMCTCARICLGGGILRLACRRLLVLSL